MLSPSAQPNRSPFLVSPGWVEENLNRLIIFDGTYPLSTSDIEATQIYLACHLPGAQRFDISVIKDTDNPLPHMLPKPEQMTKFLCDLGVNEDDTIVVYDQQHIPARAWWMLRAYGFENLFILDGGLPRWLDEDRATESGNVLRPPSDITAHLKPELVSGLQNVRDAVENGATQIVDARAAARFKGEALEPRKNLNTGHMPGALNLPFVDFLENGTLKDLDQLRAVIEKAGIDPERKIISTCGSGVTAAYLCLALASLGHDNWSLYDGSWAEWGSREDCPIEKSAA